LKYSEDLFALATGSGAAALATGSGAAALATGSGAAALVTGSGAAALVTGPSGSTPARTYAFLRFFRVIIFDRGGVTGGDALAVEPIFADAGVSGATAAEDPIGDSSIPLLFAGILSRFRVGGGGAADAGGTFAVGAAVRRLANVGPKLIGLAKLKFPRSALAVIFGLTLGYSGRSDAGVGLLLSTGAFAAANRRPNIF